MRGRHGVYRDGLLGLWTRVEELRAEARERRARVTDQLLDTLPDARAAHLRQIEAEMGRRAETLEELHRAEKALEQYRDALDELITQAPALEQAYRVVPEEVEDVPVEVWRGGLARLLPWTERRLRAEASRCWAKLGRILGAMDPGLKIRAKPLVLRARFRVGGAPFAMAAAIRSFKSGLLEVEIGIGTSVARGAPRMSVSPEGVLEALGQSFGLRREVEVGDDGFDNLFFVEARVEDARRVLSREVREAMLVVARFDLPRLTVGEGRAVLRWRFEPDEHAIKAAVRALAAVRRAPLELRLLREEGD